MKSHFLASFEFWKWNAPERLHAVATLPITRVVWAHSHHQGGVGTWLLHSASPGEITITQGDKASVILSEVTTATETVRPHSPCSQVEQWC